MSQIGFPVLYVPGRHSHESMHVGEAWAFEQHGSRIELTHTDAVNGRLLQEWSAPVDARTSSIAQRFTDAIDAVPTAARHNAWDEGIPNYVPAGLAHAHSATGGGYFGISLDQRGAAGTNARAAFTDALTAVDEFRTIADTTGPIRQPLLTPMRSAALAGVALAIGLTVASRVDTDD